MDPAFVTVAELSASLASRKVSPVDVVDGLLRRIERLNPRLGAFIDVYAQDARLAAEAAMRLGEFMSPYGDVWCSLKPTPS